MLFSTAGLAKTTDLVDEPTARPPSAAPPAEVSPNEALITTQEVLFSTAAAAGVHRENIGGRLVAIMRRMVATSTDASRPRPRYAPRHRRYLEDARMAREMDRL
jgi:hypothetical protein